MCLNRRMPCIAAIPVIHLSEPDLRFSLIRLPADAHKKDSPALLDRRLNSVPIAAQFCDWVNVSLNLYTPAHAAILFAPQALPCFNTTMSMSDSLPGISAASPFRLVSRYSLPGDLAGSPRFRRIPFDAVPLSETPVRAQWFLPIANHCMLPSSYSILSASPMTSISGLKHSLALRPSTSYPPAPSASLPPLMRLQ